VFAKILKHLIPPKFNRRKRQEPPKGLRSETDVPRQQDIVAGGIGGTGWAAARLMNVLGNNGSLAYNTYLVVPQFVYSGSTYDHNFILAEP
jgi:hypothetical protein